MKPRFVIFGLEVMPVPGPGDEKSGQPYIFRQYPAHYENINGAHKELEEIMEGKSLFPLFKYDNYVVLEIYPAKHHAAKV